MNPAPFPSARSLLTFHRPSSWDRPCQAEDPSSVMSYCNYLSCSRLHLIDLTSGKFSDGQLIQLKTPSCQLNSSQMSVHGHVHTNDSALDLRNIIIYLLTRIRFGRRWTWLHFVNSMVTISWTKISRKNEIWAILTSTFLLNLKILQNTMNFLYKLIMSHTFQSQNISRTITNILLVTFEITSTDSTDSLQGSINHSYCIWKTEFWCIITS